MPITVEEWRALNPEKHQVVGGLGHVWEVVKNIGGDKAQVELCHQGVCQGVFCFAPEPPGDESYIYSEDFGVICELESKNSTIVEK